MEIYKIEVIAEKDIPNTKWMSERGGRSVGCFWFEDHTEKSWEGLGGRFFPLFAAAQQKEVLMTWGKFPIDFKL